MDTDVKQFVMQEHTCSEDVHWDLMLEADEVLETWRIGLSPKDITDTKTSAVKIFDHALKFLTYEGALSADKGSVTIADKGTFRIIEQSDRVKQLELNGNILRGSFVLRHLRDDEWEFSPQSVTN